LAMAREIGDRAMEASILDSIKAVNKTNWKYNLLIYESQLILSPTKPIHRPFP
jgi:hypothetical protein